MQMKKYLTLILAVLLIIVSGVAVYAFGRDQVVATVNGDNITKEELYDALVKNSGVAVLDQLISSRVVSQEALKLGISVTDEEVTDKIAQIIVENYYGSQEYYEQALAEYGLTEQALKESIRIDMLLNAIVRSKTSVTAEEIEKHFTDNKTDFNIPHNVQVRHILVEKEEEANEVMQKLQTGTDFATLVKEYSKDTASVAADGDLGMVGKGQMVKEFEDVAFGQPVGLYAVPVKSEYGYHIIEILKIQEPREVEFEEVKDKVEEALLTSKVIEQMQPEYTALREAANVVSKLK